MGTPRSRFTLPRREALRAGAGAALAGAGILAACGPSSNGSASSSAAAPTPQGQVIHLVFQANIQGVPWNKTTQSLVQQYVDANFNTNSQYKGLWATVSPSGWGGAGGVIAASIAGSGYPDVVESCCGDFALYAAGGWLTPLDDYLRRDNVNPTIWSKRHVETLTQDGKLFAVPSYDGVTAVLYRQDMLDDLGLPYPDASWTGAEARDLWGKCAGKDRKTNKWRYGISLMEADGDWYQKMNWWLHGWGAGIANAGLDRCAADTPQGIQAISYLADLAKSKSAMQRAEIGALSSGQAVFSMALVASLFPAATQLGTKFKWDILPVPIWSSQRSTYNTIDFYGINRATQHPDECWELVKWLTVLPDWQRFSIKVTLVSPCLVNLWDEWEATVKAVAPPLQNKALHWFADAAQGGYAWPAVFFKYSAVQATNVINQWGAKMWAGTVSPELGLQQMAQQIDSLEAVGPALAEHQKAAAGRFPTDGPAIAPVPAGI